MELYRPLQRKSDGKWDYCCTNSVGTFALGYCSGWKELKPDDTRGMLDADACARENARTLPFQDKYHKDGHATSDEALQCYWEYELDQHLYFDDGLLATKQERCLVCKTWTGGTGYIQGDICREWPLCDKHRERKFVKRVWGSS